MSAFKSPYDREFELQAQEEHKAYQRGFNAGRKSVLDKIRAEIEQMNVNALNLLMPFDNIYNVNYTKGFIDGLGSTLDIIDKYKAESEPQESEE